jgi:hypothetical protein
MTRPTAYDLVAGDDQVIEHADVDELQSHRAGGERLHQVLQTPFVNHSNYR